MRALYIILAGGVAFWTMPPVDMGATVAARADIAISEVEMGPPGLSPAGAETLVYAVLPRAAKGPILPDLPWPLPEMAPDELPKVDTAPPSSGAIQALEFLSAREPSIETLEYGAQHRRVTATALALRSGPAKVYPAVGSLYMGEIAEVVGGRRAGWVPVRVVGTGKRGWVFYRFLAPVHG